MRCIHMLKRAGIVQKISLAASACLLLAGSVRANIIISEVNSSGSGSSSTYAGDWFELTNTGGSAVDITGWKVDDSSNSFGSALALSAISPIAPGQSVVFMESPGGSTTDFINAWFGGSPPSGFVLGTYSGSGIGLSQSGDAVNIFDSGGAAVTGVSFGAPVGAATFDNAAGLTGPISTASVVGVNGAFMSAAGEIGSPGTIGSVPEPGSALLLLLGAGLLTVSRAAQNHRRARS